MSSSQLASGLGGAIGSDFRSTQNQLIFVEYDTGKLSSLKLFPSSVYTVLGTGYTNPEDVKLSADGIHAYVTERAGTLLKVTLTNANRSFATVVASGLTAPQEIALDEAHNTAYVVEFDVVGRLTKIDLTTGTKSVIISGLNYPIGVVLSSDLQSAYISEQSAAPIHDQGLVSVFRLSNPSRQTIVKGLTEPFYLRWMDTAQSMLLVSERDPGNRVDLINVSAKTYQIIASGVPTRPSSVALPNLNQMLVCSDEVIDLYTLSHVPQPTDPLLIGIGFIPFDKINASGIADTTIDQTYFYQVKDTPFGGTLPLMVNYARAYNDGARYYRVEVDGNVQTNSWTDEWWNGTQFVATPTVPTTQGGNPGCYHVRTPSELWMNPSLGNLIDSTKLPASPNPHTILLEFLDINGKHIEYSDPLKILVDNNPCVATLAAVTLKTLNTIPPPPHVSVTTANACGILAYKLPTDTVTMGFTASQPNKNATFTLSLIRGVTGVTLPTAPPTSGPVSAAVSPITATVANLLGSCNIAGFALYLYVAATANNGWSRQSQYDAPAAEAFVLSP